jgi:hypothetical protein
MAKKETICSLFVENLKPVTRSIAKSILGPYKGGLIHFQELQQVNYALVLESNNQIKIKTSIPQHIYSQVTDGENVSSLEESPAPSSEESVVPEFIEESIKQEEVLTAPVDEATTSSVEVVKPHWYLTWKEAEDLTKQELIKWSDDVEDLTLAKSKSASEVTKIVHEFLASQFADHVAE